MKLKSMLALFVCLMFYLLSACGSTEQMQSVEKEVEVPLKEVDIPVAQPETEAQPLAEVLQEEEVEEIPAEMPIEEEIPADNVEQPTSNGLLVVIDPGHQRKGNSAQEPIGPGATKTKAKVTGGTQGRTTGIPEYQLTLQVSLKLGAELEKRGYTVMYTRTTHDVDISNSERAEIANTANADAFIRIHANGSTNPSVSGAMTICQTPSNPYNGNLYEASRTLSGNVLDEIVKATGCRKEYVWETDTMSGVNWCSVPVTIVEMGYMTNPDEDIALNTEVYQDKIVQGIANGIDLTLIGE